MTGQSVFDHQIAFKYTPGTLGAGSGKLDIGQIQKQSQPTFAHGVTAFYTNGSEAMRSNSSGNVGIGTTRPNFKLHVYNGTGRNVGFVSDASYQNLGGTLLLSTNDANSAYQPLSINASTLTLNSTGGTGNVGIGTTSPQSSLAVQSGSDNQFQLANSPNQAWTERVLQSNANFQIIQPNVAVRMALDTSGNVGVASTTPWRTLSVTGTVGFDGLTGAAGAVSLCLDSNKQVVYNSASDNCLSSTRATKHDITALSLDNLRMVDELLPVSFVYNQGDGRTRYGFIAEDTAAVDGHLATYDASGTVSGIDDRSIIAILVGAVQDIAKVTGVFRDNLIAWLGDAANGIDKIFAHEIVATNGTFTSINTAPSLRAARSPRRSPQIRNSASARAA